MNDENKTKEQLVAELKTLRRRVSELEGREIEQDHVAEAAEQRNRELMLLNRMGQVFSSTLNLDQVLTIVLTGVRRLLDANICSVWLIDRGTGELVCRQASGDHHRQVQNWRLAPGQGLAGWVAEHGESLNVPDTRVDNRHYRGVDEQIGLELRSILSVPLRVKQDVIGILNVTASDVDHFRQTDLMFLESLASIAAISVENARLYEQVQQGNYARKQWDDRTAELKEKYRRLQE